MILPVLINKKILPTLNFTADNDGNKIYYDTVAREGEDTTTYLVGITETYYTYIEMTDIPYTRIENLELIEKN